MKSSKRLLTIAVAMAIGLPSAAFATNGMNLEGYGPIATGMGGASMAYDNGTAAVMNNPATLGLMSDGSRLDLAIGVLQPDVKAEAGGTSWTSKSNSFVMPAVGWANKENHFTWGVAAFAQGGMGTEYQPAPGGQMTAGMLAAGQTANAAFGFPSVTASTTTQAQVAGLRERSEVGVMRLMLPLVYTPDNRLTVGGSIDYVRASMDLQMVMPGLFLGQGIGNGSINGSLVSGLQTAMTNGVVRDVYYGYFDFTDNNSFTGKANGDGFAGKLGVTFRMNEQLSFGATYHSKTSLSDLKATGSTVIMGLNGDAGFFQTGTPSGTFADMAATLTGTIKVVDFQWPQTYGIGVAFALNDSWMFAGDVKIINWKDSMKDFKMTFTADNVASNGGFAGLTMNATLPQNWSDQTVTQIGASYRATDKAIVRFGYNTASNPIPSSTVNYLFPAVVESHYTAGLGYAFSASNTVDFSLAYAPKVTVTGNGTQNNGLTISHSQTNYQLMYSHHF